LVRSALVDRLAIVVGAGLLIAGVWMVYVPAALVLSGLLLIGGVLWRKA
jgi:uncharacterized membrane-anchored protein YitT (DUF2179 family)